MKNILNSKFKIKTKIQKISAKENIWLNDPKKLKLINAKQINKLKVFCVFITSLYSSIILLQSISISH